MRRRPRLAITTAAPATNPAAITSLELTASERLAAPQPPRRWKPWAWVAAAVLHLLVFALFFISLKPRPQPEALEPNGISVVYDSGATASQAPRQASIPTPAQTPAAAAPPPPPPPPQTAQTAPEVNLNLPDDLLSPLPQPPPQHPAAQPQPRPVQRPAPHPAQKYMVMNNMSLGTGSSQSTAQAHNFPNGMDLSLPQTDAQAVNTPELSIKGNVGQDWQAGFNKWVYAHLYYPDAAAEQGQQGTVTVQFTAHRDGSVTGLRMVSGSGSPFLDQAWQGIFANNRLPPFPPGGDDSVQITATVRYEIVQ